MSVAKVPKLVEFKDYTHILRIPLATPASIPQFRHSWMRFQNDASLTVPSAAICNPDFHGLLVARLNLPTARHVDDFCAILRKFDMRRTLKDAATALRPSTSPELGTTSSVSIVEENGLYTGVLPLRINVLGLGAGEGRNPASAVFLRAKAIDPTNRLPHFWFSLQDFLANTGFVVSQRNAGHQYLCSDVMIVNTVFVHWYAKPGHFNEELGVWVSRRPKEVPRFDARDLIDKYKNHEWGSGISLQRICLEELGHMAKRSDRTAVQKEGTVVGTFELP